jgi:hypothetical protein
MLVAMLTLALLPGQIDAAHSEVTVEPAQLRVESRWVLSTAGDLPLTVPLVEPLEAELSPEGDGLSAIRDRDGRLVALRIGREAGRYQRARLVVEPRFLLSRRAGVLRVPTPVSNLGHRVHLVAPWRFRPDEQGPLALGLRSLAPAGFPEGPLDEALAASGLRRPEAPLYLPEGASSAPGTLENPGRMGPIAFLAFVLATGAALIAQRILARRSERDRADRALAAEIAAIDAEGLTDERAEPCVSLTDGERSRAAPVVPPCGLGQAHLPGTELGPLVARGHRGLKPLSARDPGAQEPHG